MRDTHLLVSQIVVGLKFFLNILDKSISSTILKKPPNITEAYTMRKNSILMPLFKKIDKLFFGIDEINEIEKQSDTQSENEEEFDVVRSIN